VILFKKKKKKKKKRKNFTQSRITNMTRNFEKNYEKFRTDIYDYLYRDSEAKKKKFEK